MKTINTPELPLSEKFQFAATAMSRISPEKKEFIRMALLLVPEVAKIAYESITKYDTFLRADDSENIQLVAVIKSADKPLFEVTIANFNFVLGDGGSRVRMALCEPKVALPIVAASSTEKLH